MINVPPKKKKKKKNNNWNRFCGGGSGSGGSGNNDGLRVESLSSSSRLMMLPSSSVADGSEFEWGYGVGCLNYPPIYTQEYNTTITNRRLMLLELEQQQQQQQHQHLQQHDDDNENDDDSTTVFALLTEQGKSHTVNQDRGFVVTNFLMGSSSSSSSDGDGVGDSDGSEEEENGRRYYNNDKKNKNRHRNFVMGVFDGHGQYGHNVSQRCVEMFPQLLYDKLRRNVQQQQSSSSSTFAKDAPTTLLRSTVTASTIKHILNETFWELDKHGTSPEYYMGGTTATIALRLVSSSSNKNNDNNAKTTTTTTTTTGRNSNKNDNTNDDHRDELYIANTGDSQTIVVQCTTTTTTTKSMKKNNNNNNNHDVNDGIVNVVKADVIYKSIKDKPNLVEERTRILERGGVIGPKGGRVIVHTTKVSKDIIGLAMSRSIGDWEWNDVGVIPEPRIDVIDLRPFSSYSNNRSTTMTTGATTTISKKSTTLFVMSASDGIWDRRPRPDFFARQFCPTLVAGDDGGGDKNLMLQRKLMDVVDLVRPTVGYKDDMTAVIMKLDL